MLLLVHAAPVTLEPYRAPNLGVLSSPKRWYRDVDGWPWAADNDAFNGFDPGRFRAMLAGIADLGSKPLFVTAPDVVADSAATLRLFARWRDEIASHGLPVALAAQDGLRLPQMKRLLDDFDALFIGGSTEFKMQTQACRLALVAREHGKHVHWGRVSSFRRKRYIASVGGEHDSIDGNINNRWRDVYLRRNLRAAAAAPQGRLVP